MFRIRILAVASGAFTMAVLTGPAALAAPAPVVTSVTPAADTTGSQVVVSGSNLTLPPKLKPDAVFFGQVKAIVNSCAPLTGAASSCNVTVPPQCPGAPKRVDVRVVVNGLESAISSGDGFTYTDSGQGTPSPCPSPTGSGSPSPSPTGSHTPKPSPSASSPAPSPAPSSSSAAGPIPSGPPATGAGGALSSGDPVLLAIGAAALLGAVTLTVQAARRKRRSGSV